MEGRERDNVCELKCRREQKDGVVKEREREKLISERKRDREGSGRERYRREWKREISK